ncbi:hypothetical protein KUCAC02_016254, partial [Chaenocephalus aceratus]
PSDHRAGCSAAAPLLMTCGRHCLHKLPHVEPSEQSRLQITGSDSKSDNEGQEERRCVLSVMFLSCPLNQSSSRQCVLGT